MVLFWFWHHSIFNLYTLMKPRSLACSLKHCRQQWRPYFLISPCLLPHIRLDLGRKASDKMSRKLTYWLSDHAPTSRSRPVLSWVGVPHVIVSHDSNTTASKLREHTFNCTTWCREERDPSTHAQMWTGSGHVIFWTVLTNRTTIT